MTDEQAPRPEGSGAHLRGIGGTAVAFAVLSLPLGGVRFGLSVAIGGLLAVLNFWAMARLGQAFLKTEGQSSPWVAVALIKLVALFAIVYGVLARGYAEPIALAIGYGALPVGIVIGPLVWTPPTKNRPR